MAPIYTRLFDRFKNRVFKSSKGDSSAQALDAQSLSLGQDSRLLQSQEMESHNQLLLQNAVNLTSAEVREMQDTISTYQSPFSYMPGSSSANATFPFPRKFTRSTASVQSSKSSSSSNRSIDSVGFIDQLDKFRCEIEPLREMLTASHKCTACHIPLMDPCCLPVSAPAPYFAEAQSEPKILGYVLAACAVCLRAYCEGCGKEIKEPGQGNPWFGAAVSCCQTVVAKGFLNVLSDLDVQVEHAPGGIPSSAGGLLDVITNHFLLQWDTRLSTLLMQVVRASKLFELIDDVIVDIQLANLPEVDSAKWKIYLQTGRMLWAFMSHRDYYRYIIKPPYCNVPIFRHQEGARAWIKGGCELEGSMSPMFVTVRSRLQPLAKTMDTWLKDGSRCTYKEDMDTTVRFFGLVFQAALPEPTRAWCRKIRKQNVGVL